MQNNKASLLKEAFGLWSFVILLTSVIFHIQNLNPILSYLSLVPPLLLLYSPLLLHHKRKEKVDYFEKSLSDCFRSIQIFLIVALILFPLLFVGNHFFQKLILHRRYYPISLPLLDYVQYLFFQHFL